MRYVLRLDPATGDPPLEQLVHLPVPPTRGDTIEVVGLGDHAGELRAIRLVVERRGFRPDGELDVWINAGALFDDVARAREIFTRAGEQYGAPA